MGRGLMNSPWINAKRAIPDPGRLVLLYSKKSRDVFDIWLGYWDIGFRDLNGDVIKARIDRWMLIPDIEDLEDYGQKENQ